MAGQLKSYPMFRPDTPTFKGLFAHASCQNVVKTGYQITVNAVRRSHGRNTMSQAKARLLTGMGCVGSLVMTAVALLSTDAIAQLLPVRATDPAQELLSLTIFLTFVALLILPFDIIGGLLIPAAFESTPPHPRVWIWQWSRSIVSQLFMHSFSLFFYLQIGRAIGAPWLIPLFAVFQLGLLAGQELLWCLMTSNVRAKRSGRLVAFVTSNDRRFVGGVTGLPGLESILVPSSWQETLDPDQLRVVLRRREAALSSGARFRGIISAMLWNITCFSAAVLLAGGAVDSVADLAEIFLWFLLSSFVGLLVLPTFSRRSVFALDRILTRQTSPSELNAAIEAVDQLTEQDTARSAVAESIFQPIPCPQRRAHVLLQESDGAPGAWNVARLALYLTWAFGGPLARSVHCNVGRPELWAILPVD